jgi:hypothetical protein
MRLVMCFGVLGMLNIGCATTQSNCQADLTPEGYELFLSAPPGATVFYTADRGAQRMVMGPTGRAKIASSGGSASVDRCWLD